MSFRTGSTVRAIVLGCAVLGTLAWGLRLGYAVHTERPSPGWVASSEILEEELDFEGLQVVQDRRIGYVPEKYGRLIFVLNREDGYVLWFEEGGTLRNVVIREGLWAIRRGGSLKTKHLKH